MNHFSKVPCSKPQLQACAPQSGVLLICKLLKISILITNKLDKKRCASLHHIVHVSIQVEEQMQLVMPSTLNRMSVYKDVVRFDKRKKFLDRWKKKL